MKKIFIVAAIATLLFTSSCTKNTEGNKSVIEQGKNDSVTEPSDSTELPTESAVNADQTKEYTDRYVAEDGSSALVTFNNSGKEKTISVRSNNKTISAPQKEAWSKGGIYGDHDFTIVAKNDSVTITQGSNIILLKKARGN